MRDALGTEHSPTQDEPRIVSLVPSLTELLCDLDLARHLVGCTRFCTHPAQTVAHIARMGGPKNPDLDAIRAAAPTHLIVNVDENPRGQVEALARFVPHVVVTHPNTPEDNLDLFRLCGFIFQREAQAEKLCADFHAARAALRAAVQDLPRERVLYLVWKDPWMTVSRQTYISAMLAAAGWDTLPEASEARYPHTDAVLPALTFIDRVLLATEPYRFNESHLAEAGARFGAPARIIDGEMVTWYGSRAIAGLRYLAELRIREACGPAQPDAC